MSKLRLIRNAIALGRAGLWIAGMSLACAGATHGWAQAPKSTSPVVLDRVVAVVNNQAILASDIDDEIRLSVLDPAGVGQGVLTRKRALDQLISRALIQQQIREEDVQAADPPSLRSMPGWRRYARNSLSASARTAHRMRGGRRF